LSRDRFSFQGWNKPHHTADTTGKKGIPANIEMLNDSVNQDILLWFKNSSKMKVANVQDDTWPSGGHCPYIKI